MDKIVTIVGARPQFIKAAPLCQELRRHRQEVLVHTGQHYDANMSAVFFEELEIPEPDYNLGVGSGSHGRQTGEMLSGIEEILLKEKPAMMLVYGDTNSTLAGALAASKLHIPVAHVEAGLRSFDKKMPEEQNRILTDHLSTLLFCPTNTATANLKAEGITKGVLNTGDIMYDSVLRNLRLAQKKYSHSQLLGSIAPGIKGPYNLVTIHRAENTDDRERFYSILAHLNKLTRPCLMPVHPRVAGMIDQCKYDNIHFIKPVGYLEMLTLTQAADRVVTDSGGLQKEAWFLETQCVTIRPSTEWVETLNHGCNTLVAKPQNLAAACTQACDWTQKADWFGDGRAAVYIAEAINRFLSEGIV